MYTEPLLEMCVCIHEEQFNVRSRTEPGASEAEDYCITSKIIIKCSSQDDAAIKQCCLDTSWPVVSLPKSGTELVPTSKL